MKKSDEIKYLEELQKEVHSVITESELDDGDELCKSCEDLISKWVDVYFCNKIFDLKEAI